MAYKIEVEREVDRRWIAEIPSLPGAMAYGKTKGDAVKAVEVLALRIIADQIEGKKKSSKALAVSFACR
ncbi:MAG: type II toxin-antitoxin system HicB family antitoxin [Terriglobia bacterium]